MQRITISELDATSNVVTSAPSDIVFVPGFAVGGNAAAFEPTLCTSVYAFETAFGSVTPTFKEKQYYESGKFPTAAIDPESLDQDVTTEQKYVMFGKDECDPSYVYAKELVRRGLPILYMRVNLDEELDVEDLYEKLEKIVYTLDATKSVQSHKASFISNYVGDYSGGTVYKKGNIVYKEATSNDDEDDTLTNYYKCIATEKSSSSWVASEWKQLNETEVYDEIEYTPLNDRNEFDIKYLTSGGYPVFEYNNNSIVNSMIKLGENRGDCIVFVDHTNNPSRTLLASNENSVYYSVSQGSYKVSDDMGISTMITPYANYVNSYPGKSESSLISLPGSFSYLLCLASSIKLNPTWLACAGVNRGVIPTSIFNCLNIDRKLTVTIAESYVSEVGAISINAIPNIKPYGYTIWGNRTLKDTSSKYTTNATSFLNIRNMMCDIKKRAYNAAKSCLFEQNTDILWSNFKSDVSVLLDKMVSGSGITGYAFEREEDTDKTKIVAKIIVYPVYSVESFDITVVLSDENDIVLEE